MSQQRSMEVKVGILLLVALGLLAGFVVIMGGLNFRPTYTVYVEFDNPGGLKTGAPVRIAGVRVGRVNAIEFRGGKIDPQTRRPEALIRVVATLESQFKDSVYENSRWFVTTEGVLGEFYLAVDPGTPDHPQLKDGAVVRGISPPRLDLLMSEAYELLHRVYVGITENDQKIGEMFEGLHRTLKGTGDFFDKNSGKLDRAMDDVQSITTDAHDTLLAARAKYVDNPQIARILNDVEGATNSLNGNLGPLLSDSRKVMGDASRLLDAVGSAEETRRYQSIAKNVEEASAKANLAAREAEELVLHVRQGKGTVGALVMDEALYDDVQELLRDLKHNPWKFFWRQ